MFLLGLLLQSISSSAQNEAKKWYFGNYAALDFLTSPPTPIAGSSLTSVEGAASIADANGNLLFYTDNVSIFNQTNAYMANGNGLMGSYVNSGAIIVKQPGSASNYYVFYTGNGLRYSIVDMSLAAGMGSVTVKNYSLVLNTNEKITATRHCNGLDVWIVVHDFFNTNYYSFLLTAAGVNTTAVVSSVSASQSFQGQMKLSPNGRRLGVADAFGFTMCDFDNNSGVVSNPQLLGNWLVSDGCEFSPDGTLFYGAALANLYQWDLNAGPPTAVAAFVYSVQASSPIYMQDMQLAPDGKIYIAQDAEQTLAVINNPNAGGAACGFVPLAQSLLPGSSLQSLPNFMGCLFRQKPQPFTFSTVSCLTASFVPPAVAAGYSLNNVLWDFGDPASGSANTSTLAAPDHNYSSVGTYSVQLIIFYGCNQSDTLKQSVVITQGCISVTSASITCASLGSATAIVSGGIGPFSYTWMPGVQNASVATGLNPGSYTVTVIDSGNNNATYTSSVVFTPSVPLTGNLNSSPSVACNSAATGSANITNIAGGSGTEAYLWTNGIISYTTPNPTNLTAGIWTFTVTDALSGCTLNNAFIITQPPPLTLSITASSASICVGGSISLNGTASGGTPGPAYNYSWVNGPAQAAYTVSSNVAGGYVYSLTATDSFSCAVTQTGALSFVANPTLSVLSTSICFLQTATLTASGASSYSWNGTPGTATFTDTPLVDTQYMLTGSALGCTASAIASIVVMPLPSLTITPSYTVCRGDTLTLNASGGVAYQWGGPAFSSSLQNPTLTISLPLNMVVYTFTCWGATGCFATASTTVTVKPLPLVSITPSTASICLNTNSVALTAAGNATLFNWQPATGLSTTNAQSVNAGPAGTTIYTLTGSLDGCQARVTGTVNVVAPPSLSVALSSNSLCAQALSGSPNTITLTSSGAATYTLSTPNHINNPNPSGPSSPLSMQPPFQPTGPATATLFGSNGVCTVSTTAAFTIIPNPTLNIGNPTPTICAGQSYTYTSQGASSYTWSAVTPGSTLYTTGNVAVANPSINAVFSVAGSSLGCNSALQTSTLAVNPLPIVAVNPNPALVCKGQSVQLSASGTSSSYSWLPNLFLSSATGSTVSANPPTWQSYQVTGSLNGCNAAAMITVSVIAAPIAVISATRVTFCANEPLILQGSGGVGYAWSGPGNFTAGGQTLGFTPFSTNFSGIYTLTVSDENNCRASTTQSITVYALPEGHFNAASLSGCAPLCTILNFKPAANSSLTAMSWQVNGQSYAGNNFKPCFNTPGNYILSGNLVDENSCSNTYTALVNVHARPQADFSFYPELPTENLEQVQFSNASANAAQFHWVFDNGHTSDKKDPAILFETAGSYAAALVVKNQWQCSDTAIKIIHVRPDFSVYVPNAFTPNGDDRNDYFGPVLRGAKSCLLRVFDRWGEKIFETQDLQSSWDGFFNGEPCQQGVYVWTLWVLFEYGNPTLKQERNLSGEVLLYR